MRSSRLRRRRPRRVGRRNAMFMADRPLLVSGSQALSCRVELAVLRGQARRRPLRTTSRRTSRGGLRARQRHGDREEGVHVPRVLGRDDDRVARPRSSEPLGATARLSLLLRRAESRRWSSSRNAGLAMNVVTSATTTSIVNSVGEMRPSSRPMLSMISSVRPRCSASACTAPTRASRTRRSGRPHRAEPLAATAADEPERDQPQLRRSIADPAPQPVTTKNSGSGADEVVDPVRHVLGEACAPRHDRPLRRRRRSPRRRSAGPRRPRKDADEDDPEPQRRRGPPRRTRSRGARGSAWTSASPR